MKCIKKIILINFQSHKHTEIEFDEYLNVIVGPSDHGKTSIIRALKWALFNEPSGDFFIRKGETECSVTILFSDGTKVKRFRNKSKNRYYLYDNLGEESIFEGFGTTVPQEIIDKTSIRQVILDSNKSNIINIADQLEGPFLLSEKNSTRANSIGRLVGVHIVDDALKDALKDIRNLNINKNNHKDSLEKLEKDLMDYKDLDLLINKIDKLENFKKEILKKQLFLEKLDKISKNINILKKHTNIIKTYLDNLKELEEVIDIKNKLDIKVNNFNFINNKNIKLNEIKKQIKYDKNIINSFNEINNAEKIIDNIKYYYEKNSKLNKINVSYKYIKKNIYYNQNIILQFKNIKSVNCNMDSIEQKNLKLLELIKIKNNLNNINKRLSIGTLYLDKLSNINPVINIYNILEEKNKLSETLIHYKEKYKNVKIQQNKEKKYTIQVDKNIKKQLREYKVILTNIEVCPLCFSNIDSLKINEIVNNLR